MVKVKVPKLRGESAIFQTLKLEASAMDDPQLLVADSAYRPWGMEPNGSGTALGRVWVDNRACGGRI